MKLQKLTPEEIQTLQVEAAQKILAGNVNLLAELNNKMFKVLGKLGQDKIELEQLKNEKSIIIEQNRALKSVIQNG